MKIKYATAQYTGGGIYIYYGQLEDGNYFKTGDCEEYIEICNADTSMDAADYIEFYEEHRVCTLVDEEYKNFWNEMLLWIIHNEPKGNYSAYELERRLIETAIIEDDSLVKTKEGWVFISDRGIVYQLLEGVCLGTNRKYTSDLILIALTDPDYNVEELVVGYLFGAMIFEENLKDYEESIRELVKEFEEKNLEDD